VNANAPAPQLGPALATLFAELVDGPPEAESYMLNPGDRGLLRSLARIPWEAAAEPAHGGAPIVAHVDHVRYGISLFNRWAGGEANPFATADWAASWNCTVGSEGEWTALREELAREVRRWHDYLRTLESDRRLNDVAHKGVIASVAHLAYHLGAIRQIDARTRGPKQEPTTAPAS
jgi:hypothetical protein